VEVKEINGKEEGKVNIDDLKNGTYKVTYYLSQDIKDEKFQVSVLFRGIHIKGSPFPMFSKKIHSKWNVEKKSSRLTFSESDIVTNSSSWGDWGTAMILPLIKNGFHRWDIKLLAGTHFELGVCKPSQNLDTCPNGDGLLLYLSNGSFYTYSNNGTQQKSYDQSHYPKLGDIMTIQFDCDKGILGFLKNGTYLGDLITGISCSEGFVACVALCYSGTSVQLIH